MMSPEPWLRGDLQDVNPFVAPVLYSFRQALEDLAKFTAGLTSEQVWARPHGIAPVGFEIRHIAGSVDRLLTYALGRSLSLEQLDDLQRELAPGESLQSLFAKLESALRTAEASIRAMDPATFTEPRAVGRKALPTTVIGLLTHIAEHTQRHVGQAVVISKIVRTL